MMKGLFPVVTNSDFVFPDTIFDNFFNSFENPTEGNYRVPQVDIEDTDKAYILTTDLPGIAKEDINVSYNDDILTLTAKHEEKKDEKTIRRNISAKNVAAIRSAVSSRSATSRKMASRQPLKTAS